MDELDTEQLLADERPPEPPAKPSTITVLVVLVSTALLFSYLGAYALRDALARSNMVRPLPADHDPRPFCAAVIFVGQMVAFLGVALFMRVLSWRQFSRIDQMLEQDAKSE